MKKTESHFQPHLVIREFSLPPCGEWTPTLAGWALIQIRQGAGYYLQAAQNRELEEGSLLVIGGIERGSIRASQLGGLVVQAFDVIPTRLTGLMTLNEERFFAATAFTKQSATQVFPPQHTLALRMTELCGEREKPGLVFRLKLLGLFVESLGKEIEQSGPESKPCDARKRLQDFLERTPSSELLEMNFNELAQMTHCTSRHLSRIFHELAGMSFRDKRAELRLSRARELLATTNSKVVDVALESGYRSLSLFNLMFVRHFGMSPARWRKQHACQKLNPGCEKKPKRLSTAENAQVVSFQSAARINFKGAAKIL